MPIRYVVTHALGRPSGEAVREMDRVDVALIGYGAFAAVALSSMELRTGSAGPAAAGPIRGLMSMLMVVGRSPLTWSAAAAAIAVTVAASWLCHRLSGGRRDIALWRAALKSLAGAGYAAAVGAGVTFLCFAVLVPERRFGFVPIGVLYIAVAYALTYTVGRTLDQGSLWRQ